MMPVGTSLLLRSPGPARLHPALLLTHVKAAFSLMTGGQARAQPAPWLSSLPRSSRWASCGGTSGTHPFPKESPPGNTTEPPRQPRHLTSPPGHVPA